MNKMRTPIVVLLGLVLSVSGCRSFQPMPFQPGQLTEQLQPGDKVVLQTRDGAKHRIGIVKIEDGVIHGKRQSVKVADVVGVERSEIDAGKSLGLTALIAAYASLVVYLLAHAIAGG